MGKPMTLLCIYLDSQYFMYHMDAFLDILILDVCTKCLIHAYTGVKFNERTLLRFKIWRMRKLASRTIIPFLTSLSISSLQEVINWIKHERMLNVKFYMMEA